MRKYYTATDPSRQVLDEAREKLRELAAELLEGHSASLPPDDGLAEESDDATSAHAASPSDHN